MNRLYLTFFGTFSVTLLDRPLDDFGTDKVRALLVYLALEPERAHPRRQLAGLLWPDVPEKQARQSLRAALYRLRQSLDKAGALLTPPVKVSADLLLITHQTVTLQPTSSFLQLSNDVKQFRMHLTAVDDHTHGALAICPACQSGLTQAAALYHGELLTGFGLVDAPEFEEWLLFQREMFHQQALLTFGRLAALYEGQGAYEQGATYAARLLTLDPYRETSQRLVMRLLTLRGLPDQALAQYATSRQLLMDEFGAEPEAETVALAEQIRRGELPPPRLPHSEGGTAIWSAQAQLPPQLGEVRGGVSPQHDWREMPVGSPFFGRQGEVARIAGWLVDDRCRLVSILAIGGMGKTSLAAEVVPKIADQFDLVIWRSLLNAPPLVELLSGILPALSHQQIGSLPDSLDQQLQLFFDYLQDQRVLLVLDNLESILQADEAGRYRVGYEPYAQMLRGMATQQHQGQLLLTSRERPTGVQQLERDTPLVRSLHLSGLDGAASEQLLVSRGLVGGTGNEVALTERYSGNPLALKLVADTVQDLFFGDVQEFLAEDSFIFDDVRQVLEEHFERLAPLEQELLFCLAIEREPLDVPALRNKLLHLPVRRALLEALNSLQRRSLIERQADGFALQNVITEYLTDRFVEEAIQEMSTGQLSRLHQHPMLNVHAIEYVRQSQVRLILHPIANQLRDKIQASERESRLHRLLDKVRAEEGPASSYAGGNLLNLLLYFNEGQIEGEANRYDFSKLTIRQAFLRGMTLHGINFSQSDLTDSVFTETFGSVLALAVQPNGPLLAAGTFLGPIYLYRTDNAQPLGVLRGHEELVISLAFSPDGQKLYSACADSTIRVWDVSMFLDTDANLATADLQIPCQIFHGHEGWVQAVAISPDGLTIASGGVDQTIRLWDEQTGAVKHILGGNAGRIYNLAFSPDGTTLASGSADRKIHLWDVEAGLSRGVLSYPTESSTGTFGVHAICFSPDGRTLASCSPENTICLWEIQDLTSGKAKIRHFCQGHSDWISDVAFCLDGDTLASAGFDGTVRLWDVATGDARYILAGHTNQLNAVAFSADGEIVISGGADETIRFWDVQSGQARQLLQGHTNHSAAVTFSPDGKTLATANADNAVRLWNMGAILSKGGQPGTEPKPQRLLGHTDGVMAVKFHPDGRLLASSGHDHAIYLWDCQTTQPLRTLLGHSGCVRDLAFTPDGQTLASGSYDLTACLWDIQTGRLRKTLHGHKDWILSLAISPDGTLLATASDTVRLWDIETGVLLQTFPDQSSMVYDVAFSLDGAILVAGYLNQAVCFWDVGSGQQLDDLFGHTEFVNFVAFSPDGGTLLSGDAGHRLYLRQVEGDDQPRALSHVSISAIKYAFSPNSKLLATGGDETIKLWHVPAGDCAQTLHIPGPYHGMNITGVTGISEAQRVALKALGAVDSRQWTVSSGQ